MQDEFLSAADLYSRERLTWAVKRQLARARSLPCPFCGGKTLWNGKSRLGHWLLCKGCHTRGPRCTTGEEAIERWNGRV